MLLNLRFCRLNTLRSKVACPPYWIRGAMFGVTRRACSALLKSVKPAVVAKLPGNAVGRIAPAIYTLRK